MNLLSISNPEQLVGGRSSVHTDSVASHIEGDQHQV